METNRRNTIPLHQIKIQDRFWDRYTHLVKEVLIPYQWDILNDKVEGAAPSHCIENFRIAAGESPGEFAGAVFQDTDVAKWLEAAAYTLAQEPDKDLMRLVDETINLIGRAQCEDGYLNTYFTIQAPSLRWTNLREGHELYTAGHMIEAAVAYYQATGKEGFLRIMERFADYICQVFGPEEGKRHGYPGHQEIELALVRLYEVTGKKQYLELARYFIDQRGVGENYFQKEQENPDYKQIFPEFSGYDPKYSQSHLPVREQETAEGHAVRAVYMYCAMADLAYYYQDEGLMESCRKLWQNMVGRRMYLTGSIGSSGLLERFTADYDLPNNCNYSETCASIGLALFARRMAQIEKDASYMDVAERALYNTVLSGIALDGKSFFYVNPLEVWPENCMERTSKEHVKPVRQKWFGVACCPPNIARTLASLGQYIYFSDRATLYVNLYISGAVTVELAGGKKELKMESDLTNSGHVKLELRKVGPQSTEAGEEPAWQGSRSPQPEEGAEPVPCALALRVPDYVKEYKIWKNGAKLSGCSPKKGYLHIALEGESMEVEIDFEVPARFVRANPKVREDAGKVALVKGPLVYCLEETDNGKNLPALFVDASQKIQENYEEGLLGGVTTLSFRGMRLTEEGWQDGALYGERPSRFEETELKAVPYHCWNNREPGELLVWMKEWMAGR